MRLAAARGAGEREWVGSAELADGTLVRVEPVTSNERVVGVVIHAGDGSGELLPSISEPSALVSDRLVGARGGRLVIVPASAVRFIEMADELVWLHTDDGRLRAPGRGLDQLEQRLDPNGFLRVNRQTIVNLARVRELAPGFKGSFFVLMDGSTESIAVSRRRVPALRAALGF